MYDVLKLELIVGFFISITLLITFLWRARDGNFDDSKKMMDGMLFDSQEDLNNAARKEQKKKNLLAKKREQNKLKE